MRLIFTIFIMHLGLLLFAQPANDECADRIELGLVPLCPVVGTFTNAEATASEISDDPTLNKPDCFSGSQPDNDVWFSFLVPVDGSVPNLVIEVTPATGANGPISQPQIAAYRGECGEDELAEIGCASATFGEDMVTLELFSLNPGSEIFLRIEDWTASASSNEGDFELCIKAPDPIFNIGEEPGSMLCNGQLFDSGGPDDGYDNNENNEFVICPSANFSCIEIEIPAYDIEDGFDELNIYAGDSTSDPLFFSFDGTGGPTSFNVPSTCVTVQFTSDGSVTQNGFELNWSCTTGDCENPFSNCGAPTNINNLPYAASNLSTCGTLDAVENGPCNTPGLLDGEDHVFAYTSAGDECIMVEVSNANPLTALSVYNDCPDQATDCLGSDITTVGSNAVIMMTYLEAPGTYFIIVDNPDACTDFDLAINSVNCANDAPVTCENPIMVGTVPFTDNASTCGAGNSEGNNDCSLNSGPGEDYTYAYESTGGECLTIRLENAESGTTVSALNACSADDPECFGFAEVSTGDTAVIEVVRILDPGTYYFVVETPQGCGNFDLEIIPVNCPVSLPVPTCEDALNINGCGNQPQVIVTDQESSDDESIYQPGINDGCWTGVGQARYTWFTFQAQEDGNFGFIASNAEDPTISDIDIQVWGPYDADSLACGIMQTTQPIRSTWAAPGFPNLTGLVDEDPTTGAPIEDTCEGAAGDGFVSTIPVLTGEFYLILVNDFSGTIGAGGINMDFSSTSDGVTGDGSLMAEISADTVTCPGIPVTLEVSGGAAYNWLNTADGLSCNICPNPEATITESTEFSVIVSGACNTDTLSVKVAVLEADAGTDQTVCIGEPIELLGRPTGPGTEGFWSGNTDALSCINCPDPIVDTEFLGPGEFSFFYQVGGLLCSNSDTVIITILDAIAPAYSILADTAACEELSLSLGGPTDPNANYSWTSNPPGFTSADANPSVTVSETITYYLEITNQTCPRVLMDSVVILIGSQANIPNLEDQEICQGESYFLNENPQTGVTYSWSPATGVSNPNSINTNFNPEETTIYTLTTSQNDCVEEISFTIFVDSGVAPVLTVTEDLFACVGTEVILDAVSNIPGTYQWSDGSTGGSITSGTIIQDISFTVTFTPAGGCFPSITETINIMALGTPELAEIEDQDICSADGFQLNGLTVQPGVMYNWTPSNGVVNPNELNADFNPTDTTTFQVIGNVGACADTTTFTLNVAESPVITVDPIVAVCAGSDVILSASSSLPGEFTWSPGGQTGSEITINDVNATLVFTADFTADNGCTVPGEMVTLEVIDAPVIGALSDQTVCTDETFQLSGLNEQPGVDYTWTPAAGVADPNALNNIFSPTVTTTYQITATAGDCSDTQSFTINVEETPVLTVPEMATVCTGMGVTLTASATVPGTFIWNPGNLTGSEVTINDLTESTNFTVSFEADNGCEVADEQVLVEVLPGVEITEISVDSELDIVEGDMVELMVTTEPDSAVTYRWSSGGTGIVEMVTPLDVPESSYSVTVTGPNGCTDEGTISFAVEPARYGIPNAFRPNGRVDINNIFQVEITGGNIEVLSMKIWNRFGDLVHEGLGAGHGWNGLVDGKLAPSDVYIYATEIQLPDGSVVMEQGDLTLIR